MLMVCWLAHFKVFKSCFYLHKAHNDLKQQQITVNTTGHQHSFFLNTIPIWNNIPKEIVNKDSVDTFSKALKAD